MDKTVFSIWQPLFQLVQLKHTKLSLQGTVMFPPFVNSCLQETSGVVRPSQVLTLSVCPSSVLNGRKRRGLVYLHLGVVHAC